MGKADLHIHTSEGDGLDSLEAILRHVETGGALDIIAITEHDDLATGHRARALAAKRGSTIGIVPGAEVTTLEGHLVALFVEEPIASFQRIEATIEAVRRQGGLCFVPHPMSWLTRSVSARTLTRLLRRRNEGLAPDGLELANCGPFARLSIGKARRLNLDSYRLAAIGASDAHFKEAIGSAYTEFEGTTVADLKAALQAGDITAREGRYPSLREAGLLRTLTLPITGLRGTPRKMGWRRTAWSFVNRYRPIPQDWG